MEKVALTGNEAVAEAMKQVNPDVAAVFPITPQTELMHKFAEFVADGEVDTELVNVESEHSAMSAVIGAAACGARAITATSSCGLALMWEVCYVAASTRLPIIMPVVNRALNAPLNIHNDHSDSMGTRDSGWIQIYSENSQEAYDNTVQAFRIAEHPDVLLPVMVTLDGFIISHTTETLEILNPEEVRNFVGEYSAQYHLLDPERPVTVGPVDPQDFYFEHKRQQVEAMDRAREVIIEVGKEYGQLAGREYGYFEEYRMDDAEVAIVVLGSTAGTAKVVADELHEAGSKVGLIKLRTFRPFPAKEISDRLSGLRAVAVLDKSLSFGALGGPVFNEVRNAMYGQSVPVFNYIYGLGGRDVGLEDLESVFKDIMNGEAEPPVRYLGLRE